jgi:hypothetical protein
MPIPLQANAGSGSRCRESTSYYLPLLEVICHFAYDVNNYATYEVKMIFQGCSRNIRYAERIDTLSLGPEITAIG